MKIRSGSFAAVLLCLLPGLTWCLHASAAAPTLKAGQIVEKNVASRGGAAAWRAIDSLSFSGSMDAGRIRPAPLGTIDEAPAVAPGTRPGERHRILTAMPAKPADIISLPFRLELKRPRKSRLELDFAGQTAVQLYDGTAGWKLRPYLGRADIEPFSAAELKMAAAQQDLDGLLINLAAKGSRVKLEGLEAVGGMPAYKLAVTLRHGEVRHVWIDADSFLDVQVDGVRNVGGRVRGITTRLTDYRRVDNVMIPFGMETRAEGVPETERMVIKNVAINSGVSDARFLKP